MGIRHSGGRWYARAVPTVAALTVSMFAGAGVAAAAPDGDIRPAGTSAMAGSYIVVLKGTAALQRDGVDVTARGLTANFGGAIGHTYRHALNGFEVSMTDTAARRLSTSPAVEYVQQNAIYSISATQT